MGCFTSHECITNDNNNKKGASSKCCFTPCECATDSNKHKKGAFSKCYCLKRIPE